MFSLFSFSQIQPACSWNKFWKNKKSSYCFSEYGSNLTFYEKGTRVIHLEPLMLVKKKITTTASQKPNFYWCLWNANYNYYLKKKQNIFVTCQKPDKYCYFSKQDQYCFSKVQLLLLSRQWIWFYLPYLDRASKFSKYGKAFVPNWIWICIWFCCISFLLKPYLNKISAQTQKEFEYDLDTW